MYQTPAGLAIAEIKAASTYVAEYTAKLTSFAEALGIPKERRYLIYNGVTQAREAAWLVNAASLRSEIF